MRLRFRFSHTIQFVIILMLIAIISLCSHFIISRLLDANQQSAAIINEAGRQRMFSQRIAHFSLQYANRYPNAHQQLTKTIAEFELNNLDLTQRIKMRKQSYVYGFTTHLLKDGTQADYDVSSNVSNYITLAKKIASLANQDPAMKPALDALLSEANDPVLLALDHAVSVEQQLTEAQVARISMLQHATFASIMFVLAVAAVTIFLPMVKNSSHLMRIANLDSLTGTLTRRAFLDLAKDELERAKRYNKPLSVLAIDIDYFKSVNDRFGHGAGDAALVALSTHIQLSLRNSDYLGRWGGEEFMVLLAETDLEEACVVAERYRASLSELIIAYGGHSIVLTVSIGVAALSSQLETIAQLISSADTALYEAKGAGRNRVIKFDESAEQVNYDA